MNKMNYEEALRVLDDRLGRWLAEYPRQPDHFMIVEWWKKQAALALAVDDKITVTEEEIERFVTERQRAENARGNPTPEQKKAMALLMKVIAETMGQCHFTQGQLKELAEWIMLL